MNENRRVTALLGIVLVVITVCGLRWLGSTPVAPETLGNPTAAEPIPQIGPGKAGTTVQSPASQSPIASRTDGTPPHLQGTISIGELKGEAGAAIESIRRILKEARKAGPAGSLRMREEDVPALVSGLAARRANLTQARRALEERVDGENTRIRNSLLLALEKGETPPCDESDSFAPLSPGEHVSVCTPANTTRKFALRIPASILVAERAATDAAQADLLEFCESAVRSKMFQ